MSRSGQLGFVFNEKQAPAIAPTIEREFYCRCETRVEESVDAIGTKWSANATVSKFYCPTCRRYLSYAELFRKTPEAP